MSHGIQAADQINDKVSIKEKKKRGFFALKHNRFESIDTNKSISD